MRNTNPRLMIKTGKNFQINPLWICISYVIEQGSSVARDLPPTGSEANTTILSIYILYIDTHCPYLLFGETTERRTDRGALQYLPSRAFGAAGDNETGRRGRTVYKPYWYCIYMFDVRVINIFVYVWTVCASGYKYVHMSGYKAPLVRNSQSSLVYIWDIHHTCICVSVLI